MATVYLVDWVDVAVGIHLVAGRYCYGLVSWERRRFRKGLHLEQKVRPCQSIQLLSTSISLKPEKFLSPSMLSSLNNAQFCSPSAGDINFKWK